MVKTSSLITVLIITIIYSTVGYIMFNSDGFESYQKAIFFVAATIVVGVIFAAMFLKREIMMFLGLPMDVPPENDQIPTNYRKR